MRTTSTPPSSLLAEGGRDVRFLLGKDIRLTERNRARWNLSDDVAARCLALGGGETVSPIPGVTVETLPSTDEGVAFLVSLEGNTIFHAGDLNWWHWEGEDKAWNRNMEVNFKRYCEPLRGRHMDLAMFPVDPRLGEDGFRGAWYFLELTDTACLLPVHQWEQLSCTPGLSRRLSRLCRAGADGGAERAVLHAVTNTGPCLKARSLFDACRFFSPLPASCR